MTGEAEFTFRNVKTGEVETIIHRNLVVNGGKEAIADVMRGNTTNSRGQISYCGLGTGTTGVAPTQTTLTTEIYRKKISTRTRSGQTAIFTTFFNTSEGNGTLREAGLFGDNASAILNSGVLFCRLLINRTKGINDTLTITWRVTIA